MDERKSEAMNERQKYEYTHKPQREGVGEQNERVRKRM